MYALRSTALQDLAVLLFLQDLLVSVFELGILIIMFLVLLFKGSSIILASQTRELSKNINCLCIILRSKCQCCFIQYKVL